MITTPDYKKGLYFLDRQNDSAYYYFNKVVTGSKDSLQIAIAYNSMAVIQSGEGDYFGSQETLLTSLRYLNEQREKDQYCLVSDYNELGSNSLNLKNYDAAIEYYDKALARTTDEGSRVIALNNKAFVYQEKGKYSQAAGIWEAILIQSKKDKKEYARVLCNLASMRWLKDPGYQAAPDLLKALHIRKEEKDEWGLNSSYAHLSDYYLHQQPDSALFYSHEMYAVARRLNSPDDQLEALKKMILLGPTEKAKSTFSTYERLKDSLETARNQAKNQFALIRYDAERNKSDNLRLQQENTERKVEIVQQRAMTFVVIAVLLVLAGWAFFWYRKRKQKMEWEKERVVSEARLYTSKRVHDVVANGLYRVITETEHGEKVDKEQLLDKLEVLYEQSRDISYESPGDTDEDYGVKIRELLGSFGGSSTKVSLVGNDPGLWKEVSTKMKKELESVLLELMINMKKHSDARNVLVRFAQEAHGLGVEYTDDGVGLPLGYRPGNGLRNTENRIVEMGGRIIFEKNRPKGLKVQIYWQND